MKLWIIPTLIALVAIVLIVRTVQPTTVPTYEQMERERIAVEREQTLAPIWTAAQAIVIIGIPVLLLGFAAAWGSVAIARFRNERKADARGRLPVLRSDPGAYQAAAVAALLDGYHSTERQRAGIAPVPYSYAPHVTYSSQHHTERLAGELVSNAVSSLVPLELPGRIDLADMGHTPNVNSILLGILPGGERVTVPMKSLWHIATAGPTGAGKSNVARLVVPQLQALGAKVVIADPKWTEFDAESGEDWRPIARRLHLPAARKAGEIKDMLGWAVSELDQRLERRNTQQKLGGPIFFYLDELTTITAEVEGAEEQLARLARIGRGVGFYLLMAAHNFLVKSGVGDTRDQVRTVFYLGGDLKTGSVLLDMPQRDVTTLESELSPGIAVLRSSATTPPRMVRVPYASNRGIAQLLDTSEATSTPIGGSGAEGGAEGGHLLHSNAVNPKMLRVREMLKNQASQNDILEAVWGVTGGRGYVQAQREYREIVATLIGGIY